MTNAIMGVSFLNADSVISFVSSVRKNGWQGDVVILCNTPPPFTAKYDVEIIQGLTRPQKFFIGRWKFYQDLLKERKWDYVLVSDTRDVIMQMPPVLEDGFHVTEEDVTLAQEELNASWIIEGWGYNTYREIKDYNVLCAGTVWGDRESVLSFSTYMTEHGRAMDQGTLNYAVYKNVIPAIIHANGRVVWTVGMQGYDFKEKKLPELEFGIKDGLIRMPNGRTPSLIHQYDRHDNLTKIIDRRYFEGIDYRMYFND